MEPSSSVPLAMCESCWLVENTLWEPESMDENGQVFVRLVGVGMPETIGAETVEVCCMCGELTVVGIYVLRDPDTVPFPETEDTSSFGFEVGISDSDMQTDFEDDD